MPVPAWLFSKLEGWHQISFLKAPQTIKVIKEVKAQAAEPEKLEALLHIITNDLGYNLHKAIERTKMTLSQRDTARFTYRDSYIEIEKEVTRIQFENWIDHDAREFQIASINCSLTAMSLHAMLIAYS